MLQQEKGFVQEAFVPHGVDLVLVEGLEGGEGLTEAVEAEAVRGLGPAQELDRLLKALHRWLALSGDACDRVVEAVDAIDVGDEAAGVGRGGGEPEEPALEGPDEREAAKKGDGGGDGAVDAGAEGLGGDGLGVKWRHRVIDGRDGGESE